MVQEYRYILRCDGTVPPAMCLAYKFPGSRKDGDRSEEADFWLLALSVRPRMYLESHSHCAFYRLPFVFFAPKGINFIPIGDRGAKERWGEQAVSAAMRLRERRNPFSWSISLTALRPWLWLWPFNPRIILMILHQAIRCEDATHSR